MKILFTTQLVKLICLEIIFINLEFFLTMTSICTNDCDLFRISEKFFFYTYT